MSNADVNTVAERPDTSPSYCFSMTAVPTGMPTSIGAGDGWISAGTNDVTWKVPSALMSRTLLTRGRVYRRRVKVVVIGAGGVGGYVGGRLAAAGHDVGLVARGAHLAALKDHGLQVNSVKGDVHVEVQVAEDPASFGPSDVVLVCVKAFDTE